MAKRYSAKFKFQVVTELPTGDKSTAQIAKVYGVHQVVQLFGGTLYKLCYVSVGKA